MSLLTGPWTSIFSNFLLHSVLQVNRLSVDLHTVDSILPSSSATHRACDNI